MDVVFTLSTSLEAESLIKAKLKVRPTPPDQIGCKVKILNVDRIEQPGLKLFAGTVYKDKEWGIMFSATDPDRNGHQKIRIIG